MAWTTPRTWTDNEFVDAVIFNTHIKDNLNWLKARTYGSATISGTTTSTSFAVATGSVVLTTYGGNVALVFIGVHSNTSASVQCAIDISIDGTRQGDSTNGLQLFHTHSTATDNYPITTVFITSSAPSSGSHTYEVYRKTASGTLTVSGTLYVMEWF